MPNKPWIRNGKVIVDATGKPIVCDDCPCDTVVDPPNETGPCDLCDGCTPSTLTASFSGLVACDTCVSPATLCNDVRTVNTKPDGDYILDQTCGNSEFCAWQYVGSYGDFTFTQYDIAADDCVTILEAINGRYIFTAFKAFDGTLGFMGYGELETPTIPCFFDGHRYVKFFMGSATVVSGLCDGLNEVITPDFPGLIACGSMGTLDYGGLYPLAPSFCAPPDSGAPNFERCSHGAKDGTVTITGSCE